MVKLVKNEKRIEKPNNQLYMDRLEEATMFGGVMLCNP